MAGSGVARQAGRGGAGGACLPRAPAPQQPFDVVHLVVLGGGGYGYTRYPGSGATLGGGTGLILLAVVLWVILGGGSRL